MSLGSGMPAVLKIRKDEDDVFENYKTEFWKQSLASALARLLNLVGIRDDERNKIQLFFVQPLLVSWKKEGSDQVLSLKPAQHKLLLKETRRNNR